MGGAGTVGIGAWADVHEGELVQRAADATEEQARGPAHARDAGHLAWAGPLRPRAQQGGAGAQGQGTYGEHGHHGALEGG